MLSGKHYANEKVTHTFLLHTAEAFKKKERKRHVFLL